MPLSKKVLTFFGENLNRKYKDISEEIVNPEHEGTMTKDELRGRDHSKSKIKTGSITYRKGKDSLKNAKYRLATYITLRARNAKRKKGES